MNEMYISSKLSKQDLRAILAQNNFFGWLSSSKSSIVISIDGIETLLYHTFDDSVEFWFRFNYPVFIDHVDYTQIHRIMNEIVVIAKAYLYEQTKEQITG